MHNAPYENISSLVGYFNAHRNDLAEREQVRKVINSIIADFNFNAVGRTGLLELIQLAWCEDPEVKKVLLGKLANELSQKNIPNLSALFEAIAYVCYCCVQRLEKSAYTQEPMFLTNLLATMLEKLETLHLGTNWDVKVGYFASSAINATLVLILYAGIKKLDPTLYQRSKHFFSQLDEISKKKSSIFPETLKFYLERMEELLKKAGERYAKGSGSLKKEVVEFTFDTTLTVLLGSAGILQIGISAAAIASVVPSSGGTAPVILLSGIGGAISCSFAIERAYQAAQHAWNIYKIANQRGHFDKIKKGSNPEGPSCLQQDLVALKAESDWEKVLILELGNKLKNKNFTKMKKQQAKTIIFEMLLLVRLFKVSNTTQEKLLEYVESFYEFFAKDKQEVVGFILEQLNLLNYEGYLSDQQWLRLKNSFALYNQSLKKDKRDKLDKKISPFNQKNRFDISQVVAVPLGDEEREIVHYTKIKLKPLWLARFPKDVLLENLDAPSQAENDLKEMREKWLQEHVFSRWAKMSAPKLIEDNKEKFKLRVSAELIDYFRRKQFRFRLDNRIIGPEKLRQYVTLSLAGYQDESNRDFSSRAKKTLPGYRCLYGSDENRPRVKDNKLATRYVVFSPPGGGKSTLLTEMLMKNLSSRKIWPQFRWAILLRCRDLQGHDLLEKKSSKALIHHLISEFFQNGASIEEIENNHQSYSSMATEVMANIRDAVLFIDGWDELSNYNAISLCNELCTYFPNVIVSSRHHAANSFQAEEGFAAIEIEGFSFENVERYILDYFSGEENLERYKAVTFFVQKLSMDFLKSPICLEAVCFTLSERELESVQSLKSFSRHELYEQVVYSLIARHYIEKEYENIKQITQRSIKNKFYPFFSSLAHSALEGNDFKFPYLGCLDQLFKKFEITEDEQQNLYLSCGLLRGDGSHKDWDQQVYEPLHLTIIEYFAASFYSEQFLRGRFEKNDKKHYEFMARHKYEGRYLHFWQFVIGFLSEDFLALQQFEEVWQSILPLEKMVTGRNKWFLTQVSQESTESPSGAKFPLSFLKTWTNFGAESASKMLQSEIQLSGELLKGITIKGSLKNSEVNIEEWFAKSLSGLTTQSLKQTLRLAIITPFISSVVTQRTKVISKVITLLDHEDPEVVFLSLVFLHYCLIKKVKKEHPEFLSKLLPLLKHEKANIAMFSFDYMHQFSQEEIESHPDFLSSLLVLLTQDNYLFANRLRESNGLIASFARLLMTEPNIVDKLLAAIRSCKVDSVNCMFHAVIEHMEQPLREKPEFVRGVNVICDELTLKLRNDKGEVRCGDEALKFLRLIRGFSSMLNDQSKEKVSQICLDLFIKNNQKNFNFAVRSSIITLLLGLPEMILIGHRERFICEIFGLLADSDNSTFIRKKAAEGLSGFKGFPQQRPDILRAFIFKLSGAEQGEKIPQEVAVTLAQHGSIVDCLLSLSANADMCEKSRKLFQRVIETFHEDLTGDKELLQSYYNSFPNSSFEVNFRLLRLLPALSFYLIDNYTFIPMIEELSAARNSGYHNSSLDGVLAYKDARFFPPELVKISIRLLMSTNKKARERALGCLAEFKQEFSNNYPHVLQELERQVKRADGGGYEKNIFKVLIKIEKEIPNFLLSENEYSRKLGDAILEHLQKPNFQGEALLMLPVFIERFLEDSNAADIVLQSILNLAYKETIQDVLRKIAVKLSKSQYFLASLETWVAEFAQQVSPCRNDERRLNMLAWSGGIRKILMRNSELMKIIERQILRYIDVSKGSVFRQNGFEMLEVWGAGLTENNEIIEIIANTSSGSLGRGRGKMKLGVIEVMIRRKPELVLKFFPYLLAALSIRHIAIRSIEILFHMRDDSVKYLLQQGQDFEKLSELCLQALFLDSEDAADFFLSFRANNMLQSLHSNKREEISLMLKKILRGNVAFIEGLANYISSAMNYRVYCMYTMMWQPSEIIGGLLKNIKDRTISLNQLKFYLTHEDTVKNHSFVHFENLLFVISVNEGSCIEKYELSDEDNNLFSQAVKENALACITPVSLLPEMLYPSSAAVISLREVAGQTLLPPPRSGVTRVFSGEDKMPVKNQQGF